MAKDNVSALIAEAQSAMNQQKPQEARALFLRALEVRPDSPDAHYGLATVCFLQGDMLGAAHHFKEVTRHDPLRAGAFINLGALYNHLGREDDAIQSLSRGIQLDPTRAEGYYNLGLVYRRIGQPQQAIEAYREAVHLQPDLADAHLNLANLLLDEDALDEAIGHYKTALKLRPGWSEAEQGLAIAREALEDAVEDGSDLTIDPSVGVLRERPQPIDPAVHGAQLTELNKAATAADTHSKMFVEDIARQLEAALKDVSGAFLRTDTADHELATHLESFESVADRVANLKRDLESLHRLVLDAGEHLKRK